MSEINPELYLSFAYKEPLMLFGFFGFKKKTKSFKVFTTKEICSHIHIRQEMKPWR